MTVAHVPRRCRGALVAALVPLATASALDAQAVPLGTPNATFPEDFGSIQTVRERPDGTVLVADPLGKALYVVDLGAGTRRVVGREGQGPEEYMQPDAVWSLAGDSTLLVDLGNGRLTTLNAQLAFVATMPIAMGEPGPGRPLVLALPQGVDGRGRVYARAMGGAMRGGPRPDSAAILRIDRGSQRVDTVATFKIQDVTTAESGGANNRNVQVSPIPLSPEDAWGVAADGSVAIARAGDYHVEWHGPDGSVTRGPAVRYDAVRVGTAEKEEFLADQARTGGGIGVSVMMANGQMQMSFSRGGPGGNQREIDQYTWPERKPPFYSGRLPIDTQGRVWVRRHLDAGEPVLYDVFDRQGRRVAGVTLEGKRRVVGFGPGRVYVVAYDDFDLNYLERYAMPAL